MNWAILISVLSLLVAISTAASPSIYRRFSQKPKLLIHKAAFIQVHFGPFGPGVVLTGSIQATNRQLFLTSLQVVTVHEKSKEEHTLEWRLLFLDPFNVDPSGVVKKDLPIGEMINPQQAYRYNVFFADPSIEYGPVREVIDRLRREWFAMLKFTFDQMHAESPELFAQLIAEAEKARNQLFIQFMESPTYQWAKERLEGCLYWKPGVYSMTIRALTAEPTNAFESKWKFELSEDDVRHLKQNTDFALASIAGLNFPSAFWNGCTVDYMDSK